MSSTMEIPEIRINEDVWHDIEEYADDYKYVIKGRDNIKMTYFHQSTQIIYRRFLVNHLKVVTAEKSLTHSTLHLAVYLLDIFMDRHTILPQKLLLVTNVCLLLAAKIEERHVNVPKIEELNIMLNNMYAIDDYKLVEVIVLNSFEWYLMFPTAAYYMHYFMNATIDSLDGQIIQSKNMTMQEVYEELNRLLVVYSDKILEDFHYMQFYEASRLAAASMSAARIALDLPSWNVQLCKFTEYTDEDIYVIREYLIQTTPLICLHCIKDSFNIV